MQTFIHCTLKTEQLCTPARVHIMPPICQRDWLSAFVRPAAHERLTQIVKVHFVSVYTIVVEM